MESPARPAAASVSGAFGLPPDARCSFDQTRRRAEDLQDKRLVRTFVNVYGQPQPQPQQQQQEPCYPKEAVMAAVEECMRKQADGLLHSLEGIGGRLSQLELYCYKLERSIGELRSDVMDYHSDATLNFRGIDKSLRQVQKAVQMLQDRHEPAADMAQQLAKLQIAHEFPARANEAAPLSMLAARENVNDHHGTNFGSPEVSFLPIHQVNAAQSHAMPTQSGGGYILQQLVPVSLSDQQHPGQAAVYYMQSQNHVNCPENKPSESFVQVMQPHVQNPEARVVVEQPQQSNQTTEMCPPLQHHMLHMPAQHHESQAWRSHPPVAQPQQYSVQQVPAQIAQQKTSSPHAQSTPQVTLMYPPFCSQKPANATTEPLPRSLVVQSPYSSPQQQHHEVMPSFYGQGNTILLPTAERNIQHQQPQQLQPHSQAAEHNVQRQQPQQLQPHSQTAEHNIQHQHPQQLQSHSQGSYPPQPSKPSHCSVVSYAVQGSGRAYNAAYKNPSESPATVVAVLPQHPATASMAFHHLGSQVMHNNPYGNMFETASVVGYPQDLVGNMTLPVVTAALQPVDSNAMVNKLNAGSNVTSPRDWSA